MQKRKGFTLAEVLITLGIIAVVAAITIPTIVSYFQEQSYLTQFKKAYTMLSQAYIQSAQENGTADNWATSSDTYNNLKPYLIVSEVCPLKLGCFPNSTKSLNGGSTYTFGTTSTFYKMRLTDGTSIAVSATDPRNIYIDINGNKSPNTWGKDTFSFSLAKKNEAPYVTYLASQRQDCNLNLTSTWIDGGSCSYWVLKHWNMDYLHRDIPNLEWIK